MAKKEIKKTEAPKSKTPPAPFLGGKESEKAAKKYLEGIEKAQLEQADLNDIVKELSSTWKDLSTAIDNVNKYQEVLGDNTRDYQDLIKSVYSNIKKIGTENFEDLKIQDKLNKLQEERKDIFKDLEEKTNSIKDTDDQINKLSEKKNKLEAIAQKAMRAGNDATFDRAMAMLQQTDASIAVGEIQRDNLKTEKASLETTSARVAAALDLIEPLSQASIMMERAHEKAEEFGVDIEDMSAHLMKPFKQALGFLDKVPGGGIMKSFFGIDKKLEVVNKAIMDSFVTGLANGKSVGSAAFGALRAGASSFMVTLGPILPILIAIAAIAYVIKKAFDMDKEVTEMARGLGMSKHEAAGIHGELIEIASTSKVVGANAEALGESYMELAKSMGVSKIANAEMAETQVYLKKQLGMSADEASAFQKMSMAGGKSAYENLAVIKAGVDSMTGGLMNYKEVAQDIAKSSKTVQASYKGNVAALTKAVVTAKQFGMTLDQAAKSSDAMLDIESNVEAQMTANVLTGKNMNLNDALALSLAGDKAGAMKLAMEQAGSYDELMKEGPLAQKAIADAIGMTTDEMMAAAEHQKNLNSMAATLGITLGANETLTKAQIEQAAALGNEEAKKLALQDQQNAAAEKLAAMGDKLMAIFMKIAEPVMELLDPLMELIDFIFPVIVAQAKFLLAPIMGVADMVGGIIKMLHGDFMGGLKQIGSGIIEYFYAPFKYILDLLFGFFPGLKDAAGKAIDWIMGAVKGILPDWAISLLGMDDDKSKEANTAIPPEKQAAVDEAIGLKKMDDGIIDPNGGLVVKGAKGTFQLNKDDSVAAGTDLGKPSESSDSGGGILSGLASAISAPLSSIGSMLGGKSDNSELASLLKELIAKVDQPVQFNIGGRVLDEIEKSSTVRRSYTSKVDRGYGATG